jgi:polygalacturonase
MTKKMRKISTSVKMLSLCLASHPGHAGAIDPQLTWDDVPSLVASIQEPKIPQRVFEVEDFGAVADGKTDSRPAILEAIRFANKTGGGRVVLGEGDWFSKGPIHLLSNIELHLKKGATLIFSEEPDDYLPLVLTRWEGTELFNYSPFIYAYQAVNVALTGQGVLDGNTEKTFGTWRPKQNKAKKRLRMFGEKQVPIYQRVFGEGYFLRPSMIQFFSCSQVKVEGVTIIDSPFWVVHLVATHHATVRGIEVDSRRLNNDGVDVESSADVLIENNRFTTGDDAIVIKSGRDQDGWRLGRPSERVVVRNNYMSGHNALAIGSEMSGGVRDVFMEDNELGEVRGSLYFKSNQDRGGIVENIWIRNITVQHARKPLIQFRTNYSGQRDGGHNPVFRNITIENVTAQSVGELLYIHGLEEEPIQNIKVSNVHGISSRLEGEALKAARVIDTEKTFIQNLSLDDVTLQGEPILLRP